MWFNALFDFGWKLGWFWKHIIGHGLGGVVPGLWFLQHPILDNGDIDMGMPNHSDDFGLILSKSWQVLAAPDAWIGVALGAAMLYAAIRIRRWKDEG
jgi:ABC-2 type transport system permease protein